jgi:hypothetical protein
MAGLGKCMNKSGTTQKATPVKLPHHRAATHKGQVWA